MSSENTSSRRPLLFQPLELRGIRLPNRVVISPMCQYSAKEGHANEWHYVHLAGFALGRAGLIFTEATSVERRGRITHGDLGIWSEDHIAGLKRITDFIKQQGSLPGIQLAHAGRKACMQRPWHGNGPLGAADFERGEGAWDIVAHGSNPLGESWLIPHELATGELATVREAFRLAAQRALKAGFEIVEVHGAHGYLLHGFLSPLSNQRGDRYGGSLENRMRFPLEVAEVVRDAWPQEKPVFFRISAIDDIVGGWSLEDSVVLARELKARGIEVIDCSSGGIMGSATAAAKPLNPRVPGFQLQFSETIRRKAEVKTMAVGLILNGYQAEQALQQDRADLIAIGREALYNPRWALHAAQELGADPNFDLWPEQYGWWLTRRAQLLGSLRDKRSVS
jgi:2,4-dienoyl-CoA reductase-like NADH-dependent reductase (Old Yellow Enzyme family)